MSEMNNTVNSGRNSVNSVDSKDHEIFIQVAEKCYNGKNYDWKKVIAILNNDYNLCLVDNDYNRRHLKTVCKNFRPPELVKKKEANIVELEDQPEEITNEQQKKKIFKRSNNLGQLSSKFTDEEVINTFDKIIKHLQSYNNKIVRRIDFNKFTKGTFIQVDKLLQERLPKPTDYNSYMEGKKLVRAAALTLNELLNKPELKERKQKLVIQKLKKKLKIYESYSNVLNTIISKPSNEAQQVLIKLRKNHKKRAGLKIAEWKTFVSWIIRNVKQKIDYIEKCRKRKAIRIYFDKIPSIKNVLRISGRVNTSNVKGLQMEEVEKYFNNLYSAKEADISDLEKWLNENVSERTLEFNATQIKEDINQAIAETPPFKATGPDLIHGRFWKSLLSARKWISEAVFLIIEGKIKLGKKEQEGRTFLAFKGGEVTPSNFRPITCLNITFKIITSVLNKHVIRCIEGTGLMPEEQYGNRSKVWGCSEARFQDYSIMLDYKHRQLPLYMGWLDFSKAFDTVNHLSLRLIASKLNISEQMRKLMVSLYGNWSTRFCVGGVFSRIVNLNRGSPQGDCLSPTMFCIAMAYISSKLNLLPTIHNQHGSSNFEKFPKLKRMRNHIAYIDDLKVYASSESILQDLVKEVMRAGSVLSLELNLKKCSHVSSREGILETVDDENDEVENGILNNIPYLMPDEDPYKYLGICQRIFDDREISLTKTKERILERVKEIWSLDLNVSQLIQAHNSIIPAIAGYVAGNIKSEGKMNSVLRYVEDEIDREVLSTIRELGLLQSNNCVARCYLDQDKGGLGIKNLRCEAEIAIGMNLSYNLMNRRNLPEILMHRSLDSFKRRNAFSDLSKIINIGAPVKVKSITPHIQEAYKEPTKYPDVPITIKYTDDSREVFFNYKDLQKKIKTLINSYYQNLFYEKFARKLKFPKFLDEMDKKQEKVLHMWLKAGISIEVCRRNLSAQEDQSTLKAHPSRIGLDDRCRFGCPAPETVCHILNECEYFKSGLMRRRHDSIAQIVTRFVLKKYNYDYKNEKIGENDLMRFTYDQPVPVSKMEDEPFPNKPDLVIWEKDKKRILIIEFAVSHYRNYESQIERKKTKYLKLADHLRNQEHVEVVIIPMVFGSTGEILNKIKVNFENYYGKADYIFRNAARLAVQGSMRILDRVHVLKRM